MSNNATAILRHEHEAILRMLSVTEETARQIDKGKEISSETFAGILEFLRLFADRCHHGKEEDLLFPKLEQKGLPSSGGPIGVMLYEHVQGRAYIREMAEASDAYASGNKAAAAQWAGAARGYVELLRSHIDKENNILFVMAERMLSDAEQEELEAAFEKAEVETMGEGTHERLHALMDKLIAEAFPAAGTLR